LGTIISFCAQSVGKSSGFGKTVAIKRNEKKF
jgi:hypothetical protein